MPTIHDVTSRLLEILAGHAGHQAVHARPPHEARLESLGIDSAEMINVILEIEDAFGIEVDETEIVRYRTIDDLARAVASALGAREAPSHPLEQTG